MTDTGDSHDEPAGPYLAAAETYWRGGWQPLPVAGKSLPPAGYTGENGRPIDLHQLTDWVINNPNQNLGVRLNGIVGIDVDAYEKNGTTKRGDITLALAEDRWGPLPPTWRSTSRDASNPSGIRFYRVPPGDIHINTVIQLPDENGEIHGDIEIIQYRHRFAVVWPSIHPDTGAQYRWYTPDEIRAVHIPDPETLPWLPVAWLEGLTVTPTDYGTRDYTPANPQYAPRSDWHPKVATVYEDGVRAAQGAVGSRHDNTLAVTMTLARFESLGLTGATTAVDQLRDTYVAAVTDRDGARDYDQMITGARDKVARTPSIHDLLLDGVPVPRPFDTGDTVVATDPTPTVEAPPLTSTWAPIDLATVIGQPPPQPTYLRRAGGGAYLYPGRDHILYGPSESGKSWIAFIGAAQALENPDDRVLIIDFEDDARSVVERLESLGVPIDTILDPERLKYANPHEAVSHKDKLTLGSIDLEYLVQWAPTFVVLDGVTEGMMLEGLKPLDADDVARWYSLVSRRFRAVGACVVMIDHTAKGLSDGQPTEFGSQHKRSGISGASYFVDPVHRPGRALGSDPVEGLLRLRLSKDRGGWLRGRYRGDSPVVADIDITAYPDGGVTYRINDPDGDGPNGVDKLAEEIAEFLWLMGGKPDQPGQSRSAIAEGLGRVRGDNAIGKKLTSMVRQGVLASTPGARNSNLHRLTLAGVTTFGAVLKTSERETS